MPESFTLATVHDCESDLFILSLPNLKSFGGFKTWFTLLFHVFLKKILWSSSKNLSVFQILYFVFGTKNSWNSYSYSQRLCVWLSDLTRFVHSSRSFNCLILPFIIYTLIKLGLIWTALDLSIVQIVVVLKIVFTYKKEGCYNAG